MKFRSRKMDFYYTFGLFMIYLLSISYSMPSPETDDDDDNEWRKWSDGDDDYYYDDYNNETLNNTNLSNKTNNLINLNNSSIETSTTNSIIQNIPNLLNFAGISREPKSVEEEKCPENCICSNEYYFVNCSNNNFKNIPKNIPSKAVHIDLSHNLIENIQNDDLQKYILIKDINLMDNKISNINNELFSGLRYLDTINLAHNKLNEINPNTFNDIKYLTNLDLSNNQLKLPNDGSFLNQPNLQKLNLQNAGLTEIFDKTFSNLTGLTSLNMDQNNFNKKINIKAFEPMKNLVKLKLPELERNTITDLCQILTSIDNIALKYYDVSCYELAAGSSFNDSLILTNGLQEIIGNYSSNADEIVDSVAKNSTTNSKPKQTKKMNNNTTLTPNLNGTVVDDDENDENINIENEESSYMVAISSQTINYILFGIMLIAILGLMIGIICRKDYFGIKTKMCRTKKTRRPTSTDQVRPAEEIPLNKV